MDAADQALLKDVLMKASAWASDEIVKAENSLADWFRAQGVTVNVVDRTPFMNAVKPHLVKKGMPWPPEVYERLQAIKDAE